jgi:hypothetical protein
MAVVGTVATIAALWIGAGVVRAGDGSGSAGAIAGDGGVAPVNAITAAVAAGRHLRIDGPRGPIHVWIPPGYHADTGATIIYLHGYYDGVDSAWTGHMLPEQFAMSALNALFIAPEAPVAAKTPINYPDLGEVLRIVEDKAGVVRGGALTAVIGHSGAFRTIDHWLDEPLVDQIIMIDSLYADQDEIAAWYRSSPRHRIVFVGEDTLLWTEELARDIPETVILDRIPLTYDQWPPETKTARSVYVRSQYYHMPLVMEGNTIPQLLRLLPVELLADEPWQAAPGALPIDAPVTPPPD